MRDTSEKGREEQGKEGCRIEEKENRGREGESEG